MTFKEIKELVTLLSESDIKEFNMVQGDLKIKIRTDKDVAAPVYSQAPVVQAAPMAAPAPVAAAAPVATAAAVTPDLPQTADDAANANLVEVKSPMVGTFYRSPAPEKPVYVNVGDTIKEGDVVCIIEAMKLFNEIESEVSGKIVKVMVDDASPVEYDQVLFLVDPNA